MKNELKRLDEFREILKSYKVSQNSKDELSQTQFVLLVAPTSVGRNAIAKELVRTGDFHYVVSDTTRHPRINDGVSEEDGREYWFKSEEYVLDGLKSGRYLEAAIIHNQQVSGISITEIEKSYQHNKVAVKDIEVQGARTIIELNPDVISVFVLPPNLDEWMRRLKNRGEMSKDEFKRRLNSSLNEFDYAIESDSFIFLINDKLAHAVKIIQDIVKNGIADTEQQREGRNLAIKLKKETKNLLSTLD